MGVGCSQPCFLAAEVLGSCASRTRMPVKAVAGCKCRKLSPCMGGSSGRCGRAGYGNRGKWTALLYWHGKT